jgi:hypothetical protein
LARGLAEKREAKTMRSIGIRMLFLTLLVLSESQPAMAQGEITDIAFTSDDGLVTLVVPDGAIPDDADVTITYRPSDELPATTWSSRPR